MKIALTGQIHDPNNGRTASLLATSTRHAAIIVRLILRASIFTGFALAGRGMAMSNLKLTNGVRPTRIGINVVRRSMTIVLCLLRQFEALLHVADGMTS
jgi:hypothetical protein